MAAKVSTEPAFKLGSEPPIHGRYVTLESIRRDHAPSLFRNSGLPADTSLFRYLKGHIPINPAECWEVVSEWHNRPNHRLYAITTDPQRFNSMPADTDTGRRTDGIDDRETVGVIGYLDVNPSDRTVEVGFVVFTPKLQRTVAATEAHYLILKNACEPRGSPHGLPYRRAMWKCNALNTGSRRAAERLGYVYEGTLRNHMISQGTSRDSDVLSIIEGEWPLAKSALETWMEMSNFDEQGKQVKTLAQVRESLSGRQSAMQA